MGSAYKSYEFNNSVLIGGQFIALLHAQMSLLRLWSLASGDLLVSYSIGRLRDLKVSTTFEFESRTKRRGTVDEVAEDRQCQRKSIRSLGFSGPKWMAASFVGRLRVWKSHSSNCVSCRSEGALSPCFFRAFTHPPRVDSRDSKVKELDAKAALSVWAKAPAWCAAPGRHSSRKGKISWRQSFSRIQTSTLWWYE